MATLMPRWGWRVYAAGHADLVNHLACNADAGTRYREAFDRLVAAGHVDVAAVARALDAADPYAAGRALGGPEGPA